MPLCDARGTDIRDTLLRETRDEIGHCRQQKGRDHDGTPALRS